MDVWKQPFETELGVDRRKENAAGKILTHVGWYVDPLTCGPESIHLRDVAHALSLTCRYAGHVPRFYSVAQHSCLVASFLPSDKKLAGLLHDSEEAYLLDMPSPIKKSPIFDGYRAAGKRLRRVIFEAFGVDYALCDEEVKAADAAAYKLERDAFWHGTAVMAYWSPASAEQNFIQSFYDYKGIP